VPTRRIRRGREVALRLLLAASGIAVADPAALTRSSSRREKSLSRWPMSRSRYR